MNRQPVVPIKMRQVGEFGLFFNNQDIANVGMADKAVLYSYLCFFREFGEIGAAKPDVVRLSEGASAAFRRLCVETAPQSSAISTSTQPPSGGCVLKHVEIF
ncbi:hypothetical protein [Neisseria lactamica]|uniref:hypothetical protein n=1 Tax=Neisseria lactamica TaxID=486 RepID=UPI003D80AE41